jgi:DNA-binding HxlR family transcriptional regulator
VRPELALDATLAVIGDRWSAVITGLALTGVRRFAELGRATGAAPTVLSDRLRRLTAEDVLVAVVPPGARRAEYRLTDKGRDLFAFYALLTAWSDRGTGSPRPMRILHGDHDLDPRLACASCGAVLERRDVAFAAGAEAAA